MDSKNKSSALTSFLYGLPNVASTFISGLMGMNSQESLLNQQIDLNNQVFKQNLELAREQNAMNLSQWNRANQYNLPQNLMKRLRDAGVNPALAFGNGVSGMTAVNSPSMSAGYPNSPADVTLGGSRKTIGDVVQDTLNSAYQKAQIRNLNASTIGQEEKNKSIFALDQAELRTHFLNQGYTEQQTKNLAEEFNNIAKIGQKIESEISVNFANIRDVDSKIFEREVRLAMDSDKNKEEIRLLQKQFELTDEQVNEIKRLLPLKVRQMVLQNENAELQGEQIAGQILLDTAELVLKNNQNQSVILDNESKELDNKFKELRLPEEKRKAYVEQTRLYKFTAGLGQIASSLLSGISLINFVAPGAD